MSPAKPTRRSRLTLREVLDVLELVEVNLSSMMRRWQDGIPPEVRDEISTEAYHPILQLLIKGNRRP